MNIWPDHFDIRNDPQAEIFKYFISECLEALKDYDNARRDWAAENLPEGYEVKYRFHDHTNSAATDMKNTALHMGLSEAVAENLYWAMLPHDIGKTMLPLDLWDMMEKPTGEVKQARREHTREGLKLVESQLHNDHPFVDLMKDIILNHHEQMNGKGFLGRKGGELSASARLACIVESFDGYRVPRPHFGDRDVSVPGVLDKMRHEKGAAHYDMDLFEQFAEMKMTEYKQST